MSRWLLPYIQINPDDAKQLGLNAGDLVEVYNDNGPTQAMVQPTATAKPKQTFTSCHALRVPDGADGQRHLEGGE
jgi:arsenite oxidase large subunit